MTPDEITRPSDESERQRARLRKLAEDKANLQLILRLIEQLNPLSGIRDMVRAMLYSIVDTIGGTNIKLYYFIEQELHYADFHGENRILTDFDDPLVAQVMASSAFIEERGNADSALLMGEVSPGSWTWGFPLLVGKELLGVIKLENINLSGASLRNYLPIFFSHAALILSNEIRNFVRLKAEAALHASEVRYRELMQGIHVAIVVHAADTSVLDFNHEALDLLGLTEDQIRGRTAFHPDWKFLDADGQPLPPELYPVNRVISGDQALHNMICGIVRPERGDIVWAMVNGDPVRNEQGRIAQVRISFIDITGKKLAEDQLEQSRRHLEESEKIYRLLITSMAEGVTLQDANSSILTFNKSAERILGLTADQLLGKTSLDPGWRSIHEDGSPFPGEAHPVSVALRTGLPQSDVIMGIHKPDGTLTWISLNAQPIFNDGETTPYLAVGTMHDITELKEAEGKINELNRGLEQRVAERTEQLETANRELEAFSYSVSHDLRSPLRAIDGFSRILLEDYAGKLDDEGRRLLNVVRDGAARMEQLIDDILKFSRTGRLEMNLSEIDMESLACEVADELRPAGSQLQLEVAHIPPFTGDRAMMRQVFVNLLSNAIKFTRFREGATIRVGGAIEGDEAVYFVRDNGAGFDMQFADKLFGVFQRLHTTSEFEGTGIGLAIVKRIVTRHGGRVWAESKVGEGTAIYFALPAAKASGA